MHTFRKLPKASPSAKIVAANTGSTKSQGIDNPHGLWSSPLHGNARNACSWLDYKAIITARTKYRSHWPEGRWPPSHWPIESYPARQAATPVVSSGLSTVDYFFVNSGGRATSQRLVHPLSQGRRLRRRRCPHVSLALRDVGLPQLLADRQVSRATLPAHLRRMTPDSRSAAGPALHVPDRCSGTAGPTRACLGCRETALSPVP